MKQDKPILYASTYTVTEAAETLGVSSRTIRRAIHSGKLNAIKFGTKEYRIYGEELLKIVGLPEPDKSKEKSELVKKLNESIERFYPVITAQPGGSMSVFLHQAINLYACNEDLKKIIADIEHHISRLNKSEYKGRQ